MDDQDKKSKKNEKNHRQKSHSDSKSRYIPPHHRKKCFSESSGGQSKVNHDQPTCSANLPRSQNQADKNRNERVKMIESIKSDIQQKISNDIVPKLEHISNAFNRIHHKRTFYNSASSSKPQTPADSRVVRIRTPKTPKDRNEEVLIRNFEQMSLKKEPSQRNLPIHRYSKRQLLDMRGLATHKYLNRLSSLGILSRDRPSIMRALGISKKEEIRSNLEPTDLLLLKLLQLNSPEEREEMVLKMSQERNLAILSSDKKYRINPNLSQELLKLKMEDLTKEISVLTSATPQRGRREKEPKLEKDLFDKKEEYNEALFKCCFLELFDDVLELEEKELPIPELITKLVDSNRAYYLEGEIRINARNLQESYVSNTKGKRDIRITSIPLRRYALNGDFVKILVKPRDEEGGVEQELEISDETMTSDSDLEPENRENSEVETSKKEGPEMEVARNKGCVLEIVKKVHTRQTIGHFNAVVKSAKKKKVSFIPRDPRIPLIIMPTQQDLDIKEETLYLVEILYWFKEQPYGKLLKNIGKRNNLEVENLAILLQNNLNPQPFAEEILEQLPADFEIPAKEFEYREDLRKKCIFSIDPESARDLDDAVSCEMLSNGNLEIGVHISDVSYFLKENSDLDLIVKEKATTIYLVDTVYHMLPVPLCLLCSLLPGADKMAYSVFWEMVEATGEVLNTRFTRSVINSCAKLAYSHAQTIIENPGKTWDPEEFPEIHNGFTINEVAFVIQKLQNIAKILRRKRKENGALKIDQPKLAFTLDPETGTPLGWHKHEQKEANKLIEEFMLLANISVAKMIYDKFPDISILRSHNAPSPGSVTKLIKTLQTNGIVIDTSTAKSISESMERAVHEAEYPDGTNAVLNVLVSKALTRAKYFCTHDAQFPEDFWHFALSVPMYTHFTSPIRRYADVMVHRVLNAALGYEEVPSRDPEELHRLANNCNTQKYNAKIAGDDSSNLYFLQFVSAAKTLNMRAGVLGVFQYNFEVVLIETGHVIKVYYKNLEENHIGVKLFNVGEGKPSTATLIFLKLDKKPVKQIRVHSELTVAVSVIKNKLAINEVFAD